MNINRPLMPGFLKKAEQKLLLNKPGIWSTRIHLVLYYGVLFILLLAAICFMEPNPVKSPSTTGYWIGFVSIISIIGLTVWLIYLLRFNMFKKYGNIRPLHAVGTFLLYFIATGIIVLFTYVHPAVESMRANSAYGNEELVNDINTMNLKITQLEYGLLQQPWSYDTVVLENPLDSLEKNKKGAVYRDTETYDEVAVTAVNKTPHYYRVNYAVFSSKLEHSDSLVRLNDTMMLEYTAPALCFIHTYRADEHSTIKQWDEMDLFHKVYGHAPVPEARTRIQKELDALLLKYRLPDDGGDRELTITDDDGPYEIIRKKYRLFSVDASLSHIIAKKYRWEERHIDVIVRIFYYITLSLSLLIFIFRHTTVRTFFLSLLTGVLLTILTTLFLSFGRSNATNAIAWLFIYALVFFGGSLTVLSARKRKAVSGIMLNLFVVTVPFLPLLGLMYYYEMKKAAANMENEYDAPIYYFPLEDYLPWFEAAGALLLLILLATYIGKLYRRWYSAPEN